MTLDPILNAPAVIQIHLLFGLIAVALGGIQFVTAKGTQSHRVRGYAWSGAMLVLSLGSFAIRGSDGSLSWIHGLAVVSILSVIMGIRAIRLGNRPAHIGWISGAAAGLFIAFAFTFSEGRILGNALLPS